MTAIPSDRLAKSNRFDHLDMLRGVSALLVVGGHVRAFSIQSFAEHSASETPLGVSASIFYLLTGLGHQAVIVFFVLSGFLVGGKALQDLTESRFDWARYMSRRLTRLLLVIVPALFLTLAWDKLGLALTHGMGYDGRYRELYTVGPEPDMLNHALGTFVGNLVFLQTIQVPIFGSNGPMWSLANEFWYYVVFPLAAWILMPGIAPGRRLAGAALLSILGILLPRELLVYGLIWVSGAAASFLLFRFSLAKIWNKRSLQFLAVVCIFSVLVASKFSSTGMDFIIGFAVAAALPFLARLPSPGGLYAFVARATSELSYTLYLTHMPLLTLVVFATLAPFRLPPDLTGFGLFLFLLLILAAWAAAIWWCFERHTDRMFRLIVSRFRL